MTGAVLFVARDEELGQLDRTLGDALDGHGRVCFVVGEAGSGKTALVREFARRAQDRHEDLIVAVGQSDAQTGIGDPYLPFRELLGQLTGDVDAKLAQGGITEENAGRLKRFCAFSGQAIVDLGPDLIGAFVPGVGLATKATAWIAKKTGRLDGLAELTERKGPREAIDRGGIDQSHIFEQYTNVITRLATKQPLVLVLDDLQWADTASTGLLFRLGRSIDESRVLLLGTFRPAEVAIGRRGDRHPLEKVLAEFKRYFGDISIDLGEVATAESQGLVDAVLDSEPHRLSDGFRRALFDHTAGNPLFTIELLRALKDRGDLVKDAEGRWVEGPSVDWDTLPARVEGVIDESIGRLEEKLQEILTVASVEGEDFTAEVVARVQNIEARRVVRRLGRELEQQHQLVRSRGVRRLDGDGVRLSLYSFHHNLVQRYLYLALNEADRVYLHEDVGNAIEDLCKGCPDEFVVKLAWHFVEANITDKAARYLRRAGEMSLARFANDEAVDYFTRALALTPETERVGRWDLLSAREEAHRLQGAREAQSGDLGALRRLADELDDDERRAEVAVRGAALANATGDFLGAIVAAEEAIRFAATGRDEGREARAYVESGNALLSQGRHEEARTRLEDGLGLAKSAGMHRIQAISLTRLAWMHLIRGELQEASAESREALRIFERLNDAPGQEVAANALAALTALQGDQEQAREYWEHALELARRIGDRPYQGRVLGNLGWLAAQRHDLWAGRELLQQSLRITLSGDRQEEGTALRVLGSVAMKLGLYTQALDCLNRALDISRRIGDQAEIGEELAWLGMLSWSQGGYQEACDHSRQALDIARPIARWFLEGRALDVLGHGLEGLGIWEDAAAAYEQSVVVRKKSPGDNAAIESVAGLARVALARGDLAAAQSHVDEILAHLDTGNLNSTEWPCAIYLTCCRVLEAVGDPRAGPVLAEAHGFLIEQADRIEDPDVKRAFLEDVSANREILRLMAVGGS